MKTLELEDFLSFSIFNHNYNKSNFMAKRPHPLIFLLFCSLTMVRCHTAPEEKKIHFEVVGAATANDSLAAHLPDYKDDFSQWKTVYEQMHAR